MAREGLPLIVIHRQLRHSNLGITSVYLQGIDNAEIIETVHARRAPMIPVSAWSRSQRQATLGVRRLQGGLAPRPCAGTRKGAARFERRDSWNTCC
jgi:hypothetical protein